MDNPDLIAWAIALLIFAAVTAGTLAVTAHLSRRGQVRGRLQAAGGASYGGGGAPTRNLRDAAAKVDVRKLGIDAATEGQQRAELMRAGFFQPGAVSTYNVLRFGSLFAFPFVFYFLAIQPANWSPLTKFGALAGSMLLAYYIPDAALKRLQAATQLKYRLAFPDFLDLMVVSIDAGLSLEAALVRVSSELGAAHRELTYNLNVMAAEMRAGRGTTEALHRLAERLDLEEARSLAILMQQSIELGSDVAQALRTYSDEMREKRLSRAEEKANALPVKMVFPLGVFIFPVILVLIMVPIALRVMIALGQSNF